MAETGRIRRKRSKFAQVSNHCLQNKDLSLKAKGLYALIQSLIDIPDFVLYKTSLQHNYCNEGRDTFNKTWNELKENGYLKVIQIPGEKGHFNYEYELLDEPEKEESGGSVSSDNDSPYTENPYTVNQYTVSPSTVNPTTNNTNINNTYKNNTNYNNDYSNTLIDSNGPISDATVVDEKVNQFTKPHLPTHKEICDIETEHLETNKNLDTFETDIAKELLILIPDIFTHLASFAVKYTGPKASIRMFDVEPLIHEYLITSQDCESEKISDEAVKLLNDVAESFIGKERSAILKFSNTIIKELYNQALKICNPASYSKSYVVNKNAYLAKIFHSVLARENTAVINNIQNLQQIERSANYEKRA